MKVVYKIIEEICTLEGTPHTAYGIEVLPYESSNDTNPKIASIHNITSDKSKLQNLIQLCNSLDLSPIHLDDVIQDFLIS